MVQGDPQAESRRMFCPRGLRTHTVEAGDTLWKISQRYDTTVEAIMTVNPGIDYENLRIGQRLCIPRGNRNPAAPATPSRPSRPQFPIGDGTSPGCPFGLYPYVIQSGDTLWLLAQNFFTSVGAIMAVNPGINPANLTVGRTICIPLGGRITGIRPCIRQQLPIGADGQPQPPAGTGTQPQPPIGTGTQPQPPIGTGAQPQPPSGIGAQPPMGTGTQPPMGTGTQPPMGAGTQPPMGTGMQPPMGAGTQPQPPMGAGTQPPMGAGTQPPMGAGTQPPIGTGARPQPPSTGRPQTPPAAQPQPVPAQPPQLQPGAAQPVPECISAEEQSLVNYLRLLWSQHVYWTRMFVISAFYNLPDAEAVSNRLAQNPGDFEMVLRPLYGDEDAAQFADLLTVHLQIGNEVAENMASGNTAAADDAEGRWYDNADQIALFLADINPNWTSQEWSQMLYDHLMMLKSEFGDIIAQDFEDGISMFGNVEQGAMEMADQMARGIAIQFPQYFGM